LFELGLNLVGIVANLGLVPFENGLAVSSAFVDSILGNSAGV
jgi:hypothetical protein